MGTIGRHVAEKIRSMSESQLTPELKKELEEYDSAQGLTEEKLENRKTYFETIQKEKEQGVVDPLDYNQIFYTYKRIFEAHTGEVLSTERSRLEDYKTVLCYFAKDERFFKCQRLTNLSKPSFEKGLLIVGGYGSGKSTLMKYLKQAAEFAPDQSFRFKTANSVVDEFEGLSEAYDKSYFWQKISTGSICFDDVKTERDASNFGKYNLFKDIIERRYDNHAKTFITCNYHSRQPGNLDAALGEFGERYGARVYDRIFEMFNIIEFKGNSFRI